MQLHSSIYRSRTSGLCAAIVLSLAGVAVARAENEQNEFLNLELNELLSLEITSVSKRPQPISQAAAAVFVITRDDIRRSGATTIPDALRLAPGLQVARIDGNKWAVSARGFNGRFANKLLVLMDGRTVYTPLFGGVYWDVQDTVLEDIDRIEVIRGPGASLWGSNAVNGVINIITRKASDTQGAFVGARVGNQENGTASLRYGGEIGESGHYRVYGKFYDRGANRIEGRDDLHANDSTQMFRTGFRADFKPGERDSVTTQGDYYNGLSGESDFHYGLAPPYVEIEKDRYRVRGFNLLSRWQHEVSATDGLTIQSYFDQTERDWELLRETRNTIDLDVQYRSQYFTGHDLLAGFGYRYSWDDTGSSEQAFLRPEDRGTQLFSAFLQDDIVLIPERLTLTLGSKLEHNDFTGFEGQPNIRLLWTPSDRQSVWASIGRAVRIPTRGDQDFTVPIRGVLPPNTGQNTSPLPIATSIFGSREFDSESLVAYELGYKVQPVNNLSIDLALYYNDYSRLREPGPQIYSCYPNGGALPGCVFGAQAINVATTLTNQGSGQIYGMELAADWRPFQDWRLQAAYTLSQSHLHGSPGGQPEGENSAHPSQIFSLRSSWNPHRDVDVDLWLRYMDRLMLRYSFEPESIPSYTQLDARIAWRVLPKLEFSVIGQNLLDDRQPEFFSEFGDIPRIDIKRSIYGQLRWEF